MARRGPSDPTSYTEFDKCAVKKLDWDVKVDFDSHKIGGFAHLTIEKKSEHLDYLVRSLRF